MDKAYALGDFFFSSIYTRETDNVFAELPTQNPSSPFEEVTFSDEDILERLSKINIYINHQDLIHSIHVSCMKSDT